jgi:hypothetical protein
LGIWLTGFGARAARAPFSYLTLNSKFHPALIVAIATISAVSTWSMAGPFFIHTRYHILYT